MTKFNINIGGLTPEENEDINKKVNSGESVTIGKKEKIDDDDKTKDFPKTQIIQTVHQCGTYNYNFDKVPEGLHIGDIIGGESKIKSFHIGEVFNDEDED